MPLFAVQMITAGLVLWPLAQPDTGAQKGLVIGGVLLAAGLALTLIIRAEDPWTPRYPQVSYVGYHVDQDTGRAWRFGPEAMSDAWTNTVLRAEGGPVEKLSHWAWRQPMLAATAPPVAEPAPTITLLKAPDGTLRLSAAPPTGARTLDLRLRSATGGQVTRIAGIPIELPSRRANGCGSHGRRPATAWTSSCGPADRGGWTCGTWPASIGGRPAWRLCLPDPPILSPGIIRTRRSCPEPARSLGDRRVRVYRDGMTSVTIYHNPNCGTSRNTLALLREKGIEPTVVEYLKAGWTKAQLEDILKRMGAGAHDILRTNGTKADELGLSDPGASDEALIAAMIIDPILVNRPIVVTSKGAALCRPAELVLGLL